MKCVRGVKDGLLLVLCIVFSTFRTYSCILLICTPYVGGVRSEADVASFCYTNKEQIFERELQGY